jgi:hypothetical protein
VSKGDPWQHPSSGNWVGYLILALVLAGLAAGGVAKASGGSTPPPAPQQTVVVTVTPGQGNGTCQTAATCQCPSYPGQQC